MTRDRVRHSRPFFTRGVLLLSPDQGRLPWQLPVTRAVLQHWTTSEVFPASYLEALLRDLLLPEVTALCSVHLAVSRISGDGGELRLKISIVILFRVDRKLVSWLHRSLLRPALAEMIEALCYEYIWNRAASITESQIKSLKKNNTTLTDANENGVLSHFLRDHRRAPPGAEHGSRLYPYK